MQRTIFIGTYTDGASEGIYSCRFDSGSGGLDGLRLAARTASPSFLALHPRHKVLYAVNETSDHDGKPSGTVSAFAITDAHRGELRPLNTVSSHGAHPCHLTVTPGGESVVIANYSGGTVSVIAIEADGSLGATRSVIRYEGSGPDPARQEAPHPHATVLDPAGRAVFVADLGLDQVIRYGIGPAGNLGEATGVARLAPGSGPRHIAFRPDGKFAYVINEMALTVTAFAHDPGTGALRELQTIPTVPEGWTQGSTAELFAHPGGKFLYGSNRGHDSIAAYAIDPADGTLTLVGIVSTGGQTPRSFALDPGGAYLLAANQESGDLRTFAIDPQTGRLVPGPGRIEVPAPVCVFPL